MASGTAYVAITPGVHRSVRNPLLNARPFRTSSLAFLRATMPDLCLKLRGEPSCRIQPTSASLRRGDHGGFSFACPQIQRGICKLDRSLAVPRASKDASVGVDSAKPLWWWRTMACLPYFLPLHETWNYGETAYFLHPYLDRFEFLTNPVLDVPSWFSILYFFTAYLWLVRRKELPHFVRFHIMMGMLLENALQIVWTVSRWMPLSVFGVKVGVYFWTAISFAMFFCILECMRCALVGKYAAIPCISDAAYMQIPRS
uniref:Protein TIC 20 n=1 Tax=Anthurium amnicola TaxID=1678845 RepID=A0A1D1ZKI3_9ARAE